MLNSGGTENGAKRRKLVNKLEAAIATDTTERGLERLICDSLAGEGGWTVGDPRDYDRGHCVDRVQLAAFLRATQPEVAAALGLEQDGPAQRAFLARLEKKITKNGTVAVLRHGVQHNAHDVDLFYGPPSPGNEAAQERFRQNRFTEVRQLRYSEDEIRRSLDIVLFVNGLPVITLELKNRLTRQTVDDAVEQYQRDRSPKEKLFFPGRCVAHFAVDDLEARFCARLAGKGSEFLPFNRGWNDGAGNPPRSSGVQTDYLWREVLTRESLTDILENYAQFVKKKPVWPRYHQLDVVRRLLADAAARGAGQRYLIQHSAGSGKSNSIAWLAHQLIGLENDGRPIFDSIIVVTDRLILDRQLADTIKQYAQISATVGRAQASNDLRQYIQSGKKLVISTVQKFPFVLDEIGNRHRTRWFAIIIDEAHSSQGGQTSAAMSAALGEAGTEQKNETPEDRINRAIESRKLLPNASYFAFTATPKNKTLEIFGERERQPDGTPRHRAFHRYTMKQAIQEGFILDVLAHYTPVRSYYRLAKTVTDDPEFDSGQARQKLRRFVEGNDHAIRLKAEIMVDHFHDHVRTRIGGAARAMVVTNGIQRAIQYFHAIRDYLQERKSPYRAIVAFSGEFEYGDEKLTEARLNGFPSSKITGQIETEPFRFLVCADKFQTGYDQPLLHTMYVDKILSGVKAVQTLSRLNRRHPNKHDVFVLDCLNNAETIEHAFADYYRSTILAGETDPNKLHDLKRDLDNAGVYSESEVENFVERYLRGADRDRLDPILDQCAERYVDALAEEGQVQFKGKARSFVRTYNFLSCILPYRRSDWETHSIFLSFLVKKLPAPAEDDLARRILDAIDVDSYRVEKQAMRKLMLPDEDSELDPVPTPDGDHVREPELERLSAIIQQFNDLFGNIEWNDSDRIGRMITEELPDKVAANQKFRNARQNSDRDNARIEHSSVLQAIVTAMLNDDHQFYQQFNENESFRRFVTDKVFERSWTKAAPPNQSGR